MQARIPPSFDLRKHKKTVDTQSAGKRKVRLHHSLLFWLVLFLIAAVFIFFTPRAYAQIRPHSQMVQARAMTYLYAGPAESFPVVEFVRPGQYLSLYGCLEDYAWCDVGLGLTRGWVSAFDIGVAFGSDPYRPRPYYNRYEVPIITFLFDNYWLRHYQSRPWYRDRDRWDYRNDRRWNEWNDQNNRRWRDDPVWRKHLEDNRRWREDRDRRQSQERIGQSVPPAGVYVNPPPRARALLQERQRLHEQERRRLRLQRHRVVPPPDAAAPAPPLAARPAASSVPETRRETRRRQRIEAAQERERIRAQPP